MNETGRPDRGPLDPQVSHRARGSASRGAPLRWRPVIALALLALGAAAPPAPLRFPHLAWDATRADAERALGAHGFSRSGDAALPWAGDVLGRPATLAPEFAPDGGLVAVTVRFAPAAGGGALQRYAAVVEAMRRRHGAWSARVAPGRAVTDLRLGRFTTERRSGPRSAATLWANDAGEAAAVQLDGDDVTWLRYESPRWEAARAAADSAAAR